MKRTPSNPDAAYRTPLSTGNPEFLQEGHDLRFREVIYALFITGARFQDIREAFGRELGITGPQYFALMAVATHHAAGGIGTRALADYLHVAPPHMTVEVNKLVARGLVLKAPHPEDGRRVLITLSDAGKAALERLAPFRQRINDLLFDGFTQDEFLQLGAFFDRFVRNTARAQHAVAEHEELASQTVAAE